MRVLHVCDSVIGGTGTYLSELVPLQSGRADIAAIAGLFPSEHLDYLDTGLATRGMSINGFPRRNRVAGMIRLAFAYRRFQRAWRPDIVHAHSFGAGVVTRLLPKSGTRLVYCPHGWSFNMSVPRIVQRALGALERLLARRADAIIQISQHEYDTGIDHGIDSARMRIVLNGIAADPPSAAPAKWDDPRIRLLFVGRFDRQKGLDILLEAMGGAGHHACLRVIGAPVVGSPAEFTMPADYVEPMGWQDAAGVAAQMLACDAVVIPSRWEGFGLVALEAMRLKKTVIAAGVGGLAEILDEGRFGIVVPPGDADALRAAILALTPERLAAYGASGRQRFLDGYRSDRMVDDIGDVYRDVMTPPTARGN